MPGTVVPALVGSILLLLVGFLALLAERRSPVARWFALLNLFLAATSALAAISNASATHALSFARFASIAATLALLSLHQQLVTLARDIERPSVRWLLRLRAVVLANTSVAGGLSAFGIGYGPTFGPILPVVLTLVILVGAWAIALMVALHRHGDQRQRREVAWMALGVGVFDFAGMVVLSMVLPRFGLPTAAWAPASLAAGSVVMLFSMVLTRQRELEELESNRGWQRRIKESPSGAVAEPGCRACATCGAMLAPRVEAAYCPLDGGPIRAGADPWPGRTIDERFTIERLIGAGGMGRVYRARHLRLGTGLAIKLLNADLAADRNAAERFVREARAAMRIRSPHVVIVHDLGELPPGIPFLTMELLNGVPLSALLDGDRKLPASTVAELGRQLAIGLAAAHAEAIVHRDLKPSNVIITLDGERDVAKIVDFGLAKIADERAESGELTTIGRVFGTPGYVAPEQAAGRVADHKSDVYSLGVILYRARAGRRPFEGTALELLSQHIAHAPPPLGAHPLDQLIMRMLAKDPAVRPAAHDLALLLAAHTDGEPRLIGTVTPSPATDPTLTAVSP
jgi:hypothetical protein